jgi:repressor LexA
MPPTLNDIERKILDYMVRYLRDNTYQPSIREIGERFGIKSTKTVSEHLQALADKGFLERDPSRSRGVKILGVDLHAETISLPCYRALPDDRGGIPTESAETFVTVDRQLARSEGGFFVTAEGDELATIGVQNGDLVLVEPVTIDELEEGAVIVTRLPEGPGFRRFSRNGTGIYLQPLRHGQESTRVEDPAKLRLIGRVAGLFRRMDGIGRTVSLTAH